MLTLPEHLRELAELRQWVCYRPDKVPLRASDGWPASTNNPQDWSIFDDAAKAASTQIDTGVGLVLTAQDDLVCVDLDSYKTSDPVIQQLHADIENSLDTYCEESPNGGCHIWLKGSIPSNIKLSKYFVEIYDRNRYMTVTGKVVRDVPIKNCKKYYQPALAL